MIPTELDVPRSLCFRLALKGMLLVGLSLGLFQAHLWWAIAWGMQEKRCDNLVSNNAFSNRSDDDKPKSIVKPGVRLDLLPRQILWRQYPARRLKAVMAQHLNSSAGLRPSACQYHGLLYSASRCSFCSKW